MKVADQIKRLQVYPRDAAFKIEGIFNGNEQVFGYDIDYKTNTLTLLDHPKARQDCPDCRR